MSSPFRRFAGLFVEVDGDDAIADSMPSDNSEVDAPAAAESVDASQTADLSDQGSTSRDFDAEEQAVREKEGATGAGSATQIDETQARRIENELEKANEEGFDYYEFSQVLRRLRTNRPDESPHVRFENALAMADTMGATREDLILSAEQYLEVIENVSAELETDIETREADLVGGVEEEIHEMEAQIQKKQQERERLAEEIDSLRSKLVEYRNQLDDNRETVRMEKSRTQATLQVARSRISRDIERLTDML